MQQKVDKTKLAERLDAKVPLSDIAKEFGCSIGYLMGLAKAHGATYYKLPQAEVNARMSRAASTRTLRRKGLGAIEIAKKLDVPRATIEGDLRKLALAETATEPFLSPAMVHLAKFDSVLAARLARQKAGEVADAPPPQSYPSRATNSNVDFTTQQMRKGR